MQDLIEKLTSQLGISGDQAEGGAGAVFAHVKENLNAEDFSKVSSSLGGLEDLIGKAPANDEEGGGGLLGGLGGLASKLGGDGALGKLGGLASLAGVFSKLGIGADQINSFVEVIINFVREKGGDSVSAILGKILK